MSSCQKCSVEYPKLKPYTFCLPLNERKSFAAKTEFKCMQQYIVHKAKQSTTGPHRWALLQGLGGSRRASLPSCH